LSEPRSTYTADQAQEQPLIRNCRFAFRCHQQWQFLELSPDPGARYCHECSRQVVLCRSNAELRAALLANECVAIENPAPRQMTHTIGVLDPDSIMGGVRRVREETIRD
jgi:hypothetical protein